MTPISEVLHRYDVLLIADEVVCGFGRTGKWFGTETYGMQPDLITMAKGITSAYVPLSACFVSEPIWKVIEQGNDMYGVFGHGYTYTAHPLAAAAALTNINIIERDHLVDQAATLGLYLRQRLQNAFGDHPMVAEIRGKGLVGAVEFVQDRFPLTRIDPDVHFGTRVFKASLATRRHQPSCLWGDIDLLSHHRSSSPNRRLTRWLTGPARPSMKSWPSWRRPETFESNRPDRARFAGLQDGRTIPE